nr:MAG TPA: hypothetical protein [Caudoviricetes sp.]
MLFQCFFNVIHLFVNIEVTLKCFLCLLFLIAS